MKKITTIALGLGILAGSAAFAQDAAAPSTETKTTTKHKHKHKKDGAKTTDQTTTETKK